MVGTLGTSIVFEVSDTCAFTIDSMSREVAGRWTTHDILGAKPKAEFLGADNQTIKLTITLSATMGVRPRTVLNAIASKIENGEAEYLIIGNAVVGSNPFRLVSASETWDKIYSGGQLAKATLTLTLEEYT